MLPVLPLNPAALAGSATKGPAQLWTAGLPSSAIRLLLLNPFLPHPFTNAITIPFPPTHLDQLNTPAVEFPNSHPFPMVILSSCPTSWMRINLLLSPVSWSCCLPSFHLIQLLNYWVWFDFSLSAPAKPGDSSGNTFLVQRRLNLFPKERLGWESHNECNFSSKNLTGCLKAQAAVELVL